MNRNEPTPATVPVEAPEYLDDDARSVWDRLAVDHFAKVGVSSWDVDALAVFCTAVAHHRRAVDLVNRQGVLVQDRDRGWVKHPAMQIIRDQAAIIRSFGGEFGLTPSARSELMRPGSGESKSSDRLLTGG